MRQYFSVFNSNGDAIYHNNDTMNRLRGSLTVYSGKFGMSGAVIKMPEDEFFAKKGTVCNYLYSSDDTYTVYIHDGDKSEGIYNLVVDRVDKDYNGSVYIYMIPHPLRQMRITKPIITISVQDENEVKDGEISMLHTARKMYDIDSVIVYNGETEGFFQYPTDRYTRTQSFYNKCFMEVIDEFCIRNQMEWCYDIFENMIYVGDPLPSKYIGKNLVLDLPDNTQEYISASQGAVSILSRDFEGQILPSPVPTDFRPAIIGSSKEFPQLFAVRVFDGTTYNTVVTAVGMEVTADLFTYFTQCCPQTSYYTQVRLHEVNRVLSSIQKNDIRIGRYTGGTATTANITEDTSRPHETKSNFEELEGSPRSGNASLIPRTLPYARGSNAAMQFPDPTEGSDALMFKVQGDDGRVVMGPELAGDSLPAKNAEDFRLTFPSGADLYCDENGNWILSGNSIYFNNTTINADSNPADQKSGTNINITSSDGILIGNSSGDISIDGTTGEIEIESGASKITVSPSGIITISGTTIKLGAAAATPLSMSTHVHQIGNLNIPVAPPATGNTTKSLGI